MVEFYEERTQEYHSLGAKLRENALTGGSWHDSEVASLSRSKVRAEAHTGLGNRSFSKKTVKSLKLDIKIT